MKTACLLLFVLATTFTASAQANDADQWEKDYQKSILVLEAKYPDVMDDNSTFTNELDRRAKEAVKNKDPIIQKPEYVLLLAEKLAEDFRKISIPVKQGANATVLNPSATEIPTPSAPSKAPSVPPHQNDVEKYIADAQAGRAGQNPKDVAAARNGDLYAQARMRLRDATNRINDNLANQKITNEVAESQREIANDSYNREIASIEQRELLIDQNKKLANIQKAAERQNDAMRQQQYRLEEIRKARAQQQNLQRVKHTDYTR
jgi:hypothetical protein